MFFLHQNVFFTDVTGEFATKKHSCTRVCVLISKSDHIFVWDTLSCDKDRRTINRKLSNVMKVVYKDFYSTIHHYHYIYGYIHYITK